jgi:RNA polymerase sigma-70 factor, ECF subfamily
VSTLAPTPLTSETSGEERERALIAQILLGESELFHELLRPYERGLYLAANAVLRNHADSQDAVQEAVLKAFRHLPQLTTPEKFRPWLYRIVVNEARLKIRDSHAHLFEPLDRSGDRDTDFMPRDLADWRDDPLENMECTEIREAVASALQNLPEIYRAIFILRDVQELTISECVEVLGISAESVKVRLLRARLMLREELAPRFKRCWYERVVPRKRRRW